MKVDVPAAIFVPALLISPNNAFAAPTWASRPEATAVGACTGGGGGGAGLPGGGATGPAPALATLPYLKKKTKTKTKDKIQCQSVSRMMGYLFSWSDHQFLSKGTSQLASRWSSQSVGFPDNQ